jgi:HEAT repeat protein
MARERTKHLQAAIAIDPDFEPARKALGYVKVGELWVEARSQAEEKKEEKAREEKGREEKAKEPQSQPADDPEKVAAATQANWMKRIRAIKSSLLDSGVDRIRKRGEDEILDIKDPLAILPLATVLGAGELPCRILLAKALMKFDEAEATMNIAALALVEPDPEFRADLMKLLVKRNDPRVAAQFRKALESNNDPLIRRAAYGLGELKSKEAIGELIAVLKARRVKAVEVRVDRYFNNMQDDWGSQSIAIGGASKINYKPVVGIPSGLISVQTEQRVMPVTVFRTEVLEALKKITGENFGFDEAEWTRWYQELKP